MAGKGHFAPDRARPDPVRCSGLSAGASLRRGLAGFRCAAVAAGTELTEDIRQIPPRCVVHCRAFSSMSAGTCQRLMRALIPAAEREGAYAIAAPLMPALGAIFALLMGLTLASEAGLLASAQGIVSSEAADASRLAWTASSPGVDSAPIQSALLGCLQATRLMSGTAATRPTATSRHHARHRPPGKRRPDPGRPPRPGDTYEHRAAGLLGCPHQRPPRPPGRGLTSAPRPLRGRPAPHRGWR
jgi:hypothetical protein